MKIRFLIYIVYLAPIFSAYAQYQPVFDNGCTRAFNNTDFINTRTECDELSKAGNGEASFILATLYAKGLGVVKNKKRALELLMLADEQGHAEATFNLALAYEFGKVVGVDVEKSKRLAFDYYFKAARNGSVNAQRKLASRYGNKESLVYQPEKAVEWLTTAVEQGDNKAKLELGALYLKGEGVPKDQRRGLSLVKGSADAGYHKAQFIYATLIFKDNPSEGVAYYNKAAKQGNGFAAHNLASLYFKGEHLPKDKEKADEFAKLAIQQGLPQAELFLIHNDKAPLQNKQKEIEKSAMQAFEPPPLTQNLSGYVLQFGKFSVYQNAQNKAQQLDCHVVEMDGFYYAIKFGFENYLSAKKHAESLLNRITMPYIRVASDFNFAGGIKGGTH